LTFLATFEDLAQMDPKSRGRTWRDLNGPRILHRALDTLRLPQTSALYGNFLSRRLGYGHRNPECLHDGIQVWQCPYGAISPLVSANSCALFCTGSHFPTSFFRSGVHRLCGSRFVVPGDLRSGGHVAIGAPPCTHHIRRDSLPGRKVHLRSLSRLSSKYIARRPTSPLLLLK